MQQLLILFSILLLIFIGIPCIFTYKERNRRKRQPLRANPNPHRISRQKVVRLRPRRYTLPRRVAEPSFLPLSTALLSDEHILCTTSYLITPTPPAKKFQISPNVRHARRKPVNKLAKNEWRVMTARNDRRNQVQLDHLQHYLKLNAYELEDYAHELNDYAQQKKADHPCRRKTYLPVPPTRASYHAPSDY